MGLVYKGHTFGDSTVCSCCVGDARAVIVDPTNTGRIRSDWRSINGIRWRGVRALVRDMIVKKDLLQLKAGGLMSLEPVMMSAAKIERFQTWFSHALMLAVVGDGAFMRPMIVKAYEHGADYGHDRTIESDRTSTAAHRVDAFVALAKAELTGIAQAVVQQATRAVADGLSVGQGQMGITRGVFAALDRTGINRSNAMIELLTVRSFTEGTLDQYERAGISMVGLIPESRPRVKTDVADSVVIGDAKKLTAAAKRKVAANKAKDKAAAKAKSARAGAKEKAAKAKETAKRRSNAKQAKAAVKERDRVAKEVAKGRTGKPKAVKRRVRIERANQGPGSRVGKGQPPSKSTIARIRRAQRALERHDLVNIRTAEDDDVCPTCEEIAENGPYTINAARSLIPAHPHCRCTFVPVSDRRYARDGIEQEAMEFLHAFVDYNPNHISAGSPQGGQFASGPSDAGEGGRTTLIRQIAKGKRPVHELHSEWDLTTNELRYLKALRAKRSASIGDFNPNHEPAGSERGGQFASSQEGEMQSLEELKIPREGSKKREVYETYIKHGKEAALAKAKELGLTPSTAQTWTGTWRREGAMTGAGPVHTGVKPSAAPISAPKLATPKLGAATGRGGIKIDVDGPGINLRAMEQGLDDIPASHLEAIKRAGVSFKSVDHIEGHALGRYEWNAESNSNREIRVADHIKYGDTKAKFSDPRGTMVHELGHALDHTSGFSYSKRIRDHVVYDAQKMTPQEQRNAAYYFSLPEEMFAELYRLRHSKGHEFFRMTHDRASQIFQFSLDELDKVTGK